MAGNWCDPVVSVICSVQIFLLQLITCRYKYLSLYWVLSQWMGIGPEAADIFKMLFFHNDIAVCYHICCSLLPPCVNIFEGIGLIVHMGSCIVIYFSDAKLSEVISDLMDALIQEVTYMKACQNVDFIMRSTMKLNGSSSK
jgi:hypothetical protein